jgi:hypothetical protein
MWMGETWQAVAAVAAAVALNEPVVVFGDDADTRDDLESALTV